MTLDGDLQARILDEVERGFGEQVDFLAELVKFPTLRGAEQTAQDFLAGELRARGYAVDRWKVDVEDIQHLRGFSPVSTSYENAFNVVGTHRAQSPQGKSLILNGHIDVVPVGPLDMWDSPPFEPRIEAGWMYGRGAGDMKAGLAANLFALEALRRIGYRPAADVHVQSVIEEECTGNGALACLQRGYRADAFLVPEPFGDRLVRAQIGVMWLRITVRGRPVHVLDTAGGANAIEAAFPLIQALHGLEERWNAPARKHEAFAEVEHPINVNVGTIQGGDWPSSVPAWCTFEMRIAVYPDQDLEEAREEVERCIRTAAQDNPFLADFPPKIEYPGFLSEGYVLQGADEAIGILERAHRAAYGSALEQTVTTAMTDARFTGLYAGIPSLVYGPTAENIHGFNERVELESVRRITQAIALFVAEWCGLEAA